jgi:hypothetical protein
VEVVYALLAHCCVETAVRDEWLIESARVSERWR